MMQTVTLFESAYIEVKLIRTDSRPPEISIECTECEYYVIHEITEDASREIVKLLTEDE